MIAQERSKVVSGLRWVCVLTLVGSVGCTRSPKSSPADTGSREAVRAYYEGIIQRDWQSLYPTLHPVSQKRLTRDQFARLAATHRKKIGFEPEVFQVRSCEEQGEEALGRVVVTSRTSRHKQRYNEGIVVRRVAGAWRVVLPENFGR